VRQDSANRSFLALMGITLLPAVYVLCGVVGSVLGPLVLARVSHDGLVGLVSGGGSWFAVLAFIAMVTVGLTLGGRSLARQIVASRRLARRVRGLALALPSDLAQTAMQAGLGGRVVLVDAPEWFSFAYGAITPRVAVSRGLLEGVSPEELRAVLEHEGYHICNLDPLKLVLVQSLSATFFFLPALDSLRVRYVAGRELAADRRAIRACGERPLAGALLKVVRGPAWSELEVAAAIGGPELLDVRVAQLETGNEPKLATLSIARATLSLLGVVLFAAVFVVSVFSLGGPAALYRTTGDGLSTAGLLGPVSCAAPFAAVGLIAYWLIAHRARRSLKVKVVNMRS
jgi:Zn-dependent protease with chaperone function